MLSTFAAAFRTPDLRKKLLFVLGIVTLFRIGSFLPTPGVDYSAVQACIDVSQENTIYGLINMFTGGALLQLSVFALGIMPYITASIILQLLVVVIPRLEALKKEGQTGQTKITQYTRYLTIGLALLQSATIVTLARTPGRLIQGCPEQLVPDQSIAQLVVMIIVLTAGTTLIMWFGELITARGVGNGMSLLIFASIIAGFPGQLLGILRMNGLGQLIIVLALGIAIIAFIVFIEQAQRRIPVQYAKRMVGRKMYGGTSTYIPLKVNMAGVIPIIFSSSLLYIPLLLQELTDAQDGWALWVTQNLLPGANMYMLVNFVLTVFFAFFYVSITFNPVDIADNMKKYGGFIPGIRSGTPTVNYLAYVINRLTTPGSLYLASVATLPFVVFSISGVSSNFMFAGISLLIMVGVGLDTVKQIESQLQQRSYEGFLR